MRARLAALLGGVLAIGFGGCGDDRPALTPHTGCTQLDAIPRRLWRLSAMQYGNALKDLLNLDAAPVLSNNGGTAQYAFFSDDAASVDSNFQFSIFQTVEAAMPQIAPQIPQRSSEALQKFQAMMDVDGNSLPDNTVVAAYVSEVGRAYDHDQRNMPFLVFGGKNTKIAGGQFLKIDSGPQPGLDGPNTNRPLNDAWLAMAPIFGINDMTSLGAPTQWSGPLPGFINA